MIEGVLKVVGEALHERADHLAVFVREASHQLAQESSGDFGDYGECGERQRTGQILLDPKLAS